MDECNMVEVNLSTLSVQKLHDLLLQYNYDKSKLNSHQKTLIVLQGCIGSGKSTLLKAMKKVFGKRLSVVDEPTKCWSKMIDDEGTDILSLFYGDMSKWAFIFQLVAYISRARNLYNAYYKSDCDIIVMERSAETDLHVFAKKMYDDDMMSEIEWKLYHWLFDFLNLHTSGTIYVETPAEVCADRIIFRGRPGEENIKLEYLQSLISYHDLWLKDEKKKNVLLIDGQTVFTSKSNIQLIEKFIEKLLRNDFAAASPIVLSDGDTNDCRFQETTNVTVEDIIAEINKRVFYPALLKNHGKKVISIVGNIGAGKTSLLAHLKNRYTSAETDYTSENKETDDSLLNNEGQKFGQRILFIDEPTSSWQGLKDSSGRGLIELFYSDIDSWAFIFQIVTFISRSRALFEALSNPDYDIIVVERSVESDRKIFAKKMFADGMMNQIEKKIYDMWYDFLDMSITSIIYVKTPVKVCHSRISKRQRKGEQGIKLPYLRSLAYYHHLWLSDLKENKPNTVHVVDSLTDFSSEEFLSQIDTFISSD